MNYERKAVISMEKKTKPGEKGFTLILFVIGALFTKGSLDMYRADPTLEGYGTVPLFCGLMIMVLSAFILLGSLRTKSEISGQPVGEQASAVKKHLFNGDVIVMLLIILAYCGLLAFNVPFIISSPLFLWGSMTYLCRGGWLKNIIYTALVMIFVILVFSVGFNVVLP